MNRPPLLVLPPANRMRRSTDFTSVVRRGRRARGHLVAVHQLAVRPAGPVAVGLVAAGSVAGTVVAVEPGLHSPIVGLIVGKSVGGSVVRHRVSRRLRAQLADRLDRLPATSATVVRALPGAASATSADLGAELDTALARLGSR